MSAPCSLTHAAGADGVSSCWATHSGVEGSTGATEAQIEANPAAHGFTVHSGELDAVANTTYDHVWVQNGCISIPTGANNVTIKNVLVTTNGNYCQGGDHATAPAGINDGNGTSPTGLLVEDTTVDGGNTAIDSFGISINNAECLRCSALGFTKNFTTGSNLASRTLFQDDYSHDLSNAGCTHDNGFYMNSSDNFTIEHSYSIANGAGSGCVTGAITNLADYGTPHDFTVDNSYMEGISGADLYTGKGSSCGTPNVVITNDAFSSDNGYGGTQLADYWTPTGNVWSGNHIAETGVALSPPKGSC